MSGAKLTFRQRDVTAAIKAIEAAGQRVCRVEIERDGKFVVLLARPGDDKPVTNDLDKWLAEHAHSPEGR